MLKTMMRSLYRLGCLGKFQIAGPVHSSAPSPRLSYAGLCLGGDPSVHGGNVKLRVLRQVFPEFRRECNLLYLVSSGLSVRSEAWAEAGLSKGIPLVWNQNGVAYPAWAPKDHERINARMRRLLHRASFVIYQSDFCRRMSDKYLGHLSGQSSVVYNAVDTKKFFPGELGRSFGSELKLLVVGSHADRRRFLWALETVARLRKRKINVSLDVAGRLSWPGAKEEIRVALDRLRLVDGVRILGAFSQSEAPDLYRGAHLLLHLQHGDACPTVVLEAMASGLPVVAPSSGGIPELVGDGGVLISAPDAEDVFSPDIEQVADAVQRAIEERRSLSLRARARVEQHFCHSQWIERHREIFERVLRGNGSEKRKE